MKFLMRVSGLLILSFSVVAQTDSTDLLHLQLQQVQTQEEKIDLLNKLSYEYTQSSLSSAEILANEALEEAIGANYKKGIATSYNNLGITHSIRGDYGAGLDYFIKALRIREELNDITGVSSTLTNIARVFHYQHNFEMALEYTNKSLELHDKTNDSLGLAHAYISLAEIYHTMNENSKALETIEKARNISAQTRNENLEGWALVKMAGVLESEKKYNEGLATCLLAKGKIDGTQDLFTTIELYQTIGSIYSGMGNAVEARKHLCHAMKMADKGKDSKGSISSRMKLSNMFRQFKEFDSAFHYMDDYARLNAEVFNTETSREIMTLEKIYQQEKTNKLLELKNQKIQAQSIVITIISLLLLVTATLGFVIYRYYREKKKSAMALEELNHEINQKHEEIVVKSEELASANEEIKRINGSLEQEVMIRSQKIEQQNKKLIDYAYFNAHNVRGPLARILGLSYLMERESTVSQIREYNAYLLVAATELDNVIKDINSTLE